MARTGRDPPDALGVERQAAAEARAYHDRVVRPLGLDARRAALGSFAREFYERRLRLHPSPAQRRSLEALANQDSLVLEIAHDGQLPHLGVVRMVLKTREIARIDGRAVALYLVGNHYSAKMRPDNVHFGMPLKGQAPDQVRHPPKVRIGRANDHKPFRWIPPPTREDLERLHSQLREFVGHNLDHVRTRGPPVRREAKTVILERLRDLFASLKQDAAEVSNFGDWLIRAQHGMFTRMLREEGNDVLFLPMAEVLDFLREDLRTVARSLSKVEGFGSDESSGFWMYCPLCSRRQRHAWTGEDSVDFHCLQCSHDARVSREDLWRWLFPDIVTYEAALFRLGVDGWLVGSAASYHPPIERVYRAAFGLEMPPKFFLTSVPTFRGIGEPPEGFARTRLLRALLEVPPADLAEKLSAPWTENPEIVSEFIKG